MYTSSLSFLSIAISVLSLYLSPSPVRVPPSLSPLVPHLSAMNHVGHKSHHPNTHHTQVTPQSSLPSAPSSMSLAAPVPVVTAVGGLQAGQAEAASHLADHTALAGCSDRGQYGMSLSQAIRAVVAIQHLSLSSAHRIAMPRQRPTQECG